MGPAQLPNARQATMRPRPRTRDWLPRNSMPVQAHGAHLARSRRRSADTSFPRANWSAKNLRPTHPNLGSFPRFRQRSRCQTMEWVLPRQRPPDHRLFRREGTCPRVQPMARERYAPPLETEVDSGGAESVNASVQKESNATRTGNQTSGLRIVSEFWPTLQLRPLGHRYPTTKGHAR